MTVTDANGKFDIVDADSCGGNSDGGIFSQSSFQKRLFANRLAIPTKGRIPGTDIELPYVFVAGKAFPLSKHIMKPFTQRQLTDSKSIFNYRLFRARNCVETSFGRLAQIWHILHRKIDEQPLNATNIEKAITVLHNFFIINEPHRLMVTVTEGESQDPIQSVCNRATNDALQTRELFMNYFQSPVGSVSWQNRKCFISD